jgi:hypothetical protein
MSRPRRKRGHFTMRSRRAATRSAPPLNCGVRRMLRVIILLATLVALAACGTRVYAPTASQVCSNLSNDDDRTLCESQLASAIASARNTAGEASAGVTMLGLGYVSWVWYVAYYIIGFVFARFVYIDARKREWLAFRVKPFWWGALCVFDPAFGALIYWIIHYSRLVRRGHA